VEALGERSAAERRDLQRLQRKEDLLAEYEAQRVAKVAVLDQLEDKASDVRGELERLQEEQSKARAAADDAATQVRESIDQLVAEKKEMQAELVDVRDALARRKSELATYEMQIQDWERREEQVVTQTTELTEREREVANREREVRLREEVMQKREGELKEALEATRAARRVTGRGVPTGPSGPTIMAPEDMWEPEDDELESKREELFAMMAQ